MPARELKGVCVTERERSNSERERECRGQERDRECDKELEE